MDNLTGLVAVTMLLGMPTAAFAMYTFYRVRKLRSEERMAAIARGITVPMAPDLTEAARSRRSGILLVAGAIGYMITFTLIARVEPDAWIAASVRFTQDHLVTFDLGFLRLLSRNELTILT